MPKTRRNPFRRAEKILAVIGWTAIGLFAIPVVWVIGLTMSEEWGWWSLLIIPALPAALLVFGLIAGGLVSLEYQWKRAKYRWDRNAQREGDLS